MMKNVPDCLLPYPTLQSKHSIYFIFYLIFGRFWKTEEIINFIQFSYWFRDCFVRLFPFGFLGSCFRKWNVWKVSWTAITIYIFLKSLLFSFLTFKNFDYNLLKETSLFFFKIEVIDSCESKTILRGLHNLLVIIVVVMIWIETDYVDIVKPSIWVDLM